MRLITEDQKTRAHVIKGQKLSEEVYPQATRTQAIQRAPVLCDNLTTNEYQLRLGKQSSYMFI
jgi:hypothetical protein